MEYERSVNGKRGSRKKDPKTENCYVHWKEEMRKVARKVEKDRGMKSKASGFKEEGWAQNMEYRGKCSMCQKSVFCCC